MAGSSRTTGLRPNPASDRTAGRPGQNLPAGMYVAQVVSNEDSTNTGRVSVRIGEYGNLPDAPAEFSALLMTPMGGSSAPRDTGSDTSDPNASVSSFGVWPQPPAPGTTVMVQFDPGLQQPVLMGSLISAPTNHNMGGNASGETEDGSLGPVGEQNPRYTDDPQTKPAETERQQQLETQGLEGDHVRGHSMSSARRESPSRVFGVTTAGGAVLTMDDGDADGNSQNIRIRTPGGGQVLIDDTTGIVFITNQSGSTHIEMNAAGCIDIYSENSFSVASAQDINFHAQGNINMQADQGINIMAGGDGIKAESGADIDMKSTAATRIHADSTVHVKGGSSINQTAPTINSNSPAAAEPAVKPVPGGLPENSGVTESVAGRVPERHPWNGVPGVQETFTSAAGKPR